MAFLFFLSVDLPPQVSSVGFPGRLSALGSRLSALGRGSGHESGPGSGVWV